jgi:hypothetical protein
MKNITKLLAAAFAIGLFFTMTFAQTDANPTASVKDTKVTGEQNQSDSNRTVTVRVLNVVHIKRDKKPGEAAQQNSLIFCWSSDENTAASYRLKVWQLMQGQNAETTMRTNLPIVTKDVDNVTASNSSKKLNNKNPELMRGVGSEEMAASNNSDAIKACMETFEAQEHAINTKGAGSGDRSSTQTDIAAKPLSIQTKGAGGDRSVTNPQTTLNPIRAFVVDNFPVCAKGSSCEYVGTVEALNADGSLVNSTDRRFFRVRYVEHPIYPKIYAQ